MAKSNNELSIIVNCMFLDHEVNEFTDKNNNIIKWVSIELLEKKSKCKITTNLKMKIEEFELLKLEEFDTVSAELLIGFGEKMTCKCIRLWKD